MTASLLKKASKLPVPDRIKLVEDIWNSITEDREDIALTLTQKRELDRRLDLMKENPARGVTWEEAKRRILKRVSRSK